MSDTTQPTTPAGLLLSRAREIVEGKRRDEHGAPERSFKVIADYWTLYLRANGLLADGLAVQPHQVCRLMELLKIARGDGLDNCLDAAGYSALAWEVQPKPAAQDDRVRPPRGQDINAYAADAAAEVVGVLRADGMVTFERLEELARVHDASAAALERDLEKRRP